MGVISWGEGGGVGGRKLHEEEEEGKREGDGYRPFFSPSLLVESSDVRLAGRLPAAYSRKKREKST